MSWIPILLRSEALRALVSAVSVTAWLLFTRGSPSGTALFAAVIFEEQSTQSSPIGASGLSDTLNSPPAFAAVLSLNPAPHRVGARPPRTVAAELPLAFAR